MKINQTNDDSMMNHLLESLPAEEFARIQPYLESVTLSLGEVLYESGDTMSHIYFPTSVIISLLYIMENGGTSEIGIAGNSGLIGMALYMGGETTSSRAVVQSAGNAVRMRSAEMKKEFQLGGIFQDILLRYAQSMITQISQTAVCNRLHSVQDQLCRWLLINHDQLPGDTLVMTHDLIANMLGVRREGVTQAAGFLQNNGYIKYVRGTVTMLDRPGLEKICCECYKVVAEEYDRLLGKYLRKNKHRAKPVLAVV
ncbi:MAG: Crp/Fnr family transcriptional regulator, partial [Acidobacteriota bacterium]